MAKLDTDRIWRSLGTFWDLFPQDERVYLATFWESFADIVADLWGLTFQIDRAKSLFSTTAMFERRNVLVQLSGLQRQKSFEFELSSVVTTPLGAVVVRGFVPRDKRTFLATEIPSQGLVRIGVDTLRYLFVNVVAITEGPFAGYVREATFTLEASSLPHNYGDSLDMNDSFYRQEIELAFRVGQNPGDTYVDATSDGVDLDLNATGLLRFGTPGLNYEQVQYRALAVTGDRYVFTLPSTWGPGQSSAPALLYAHAQDEAVLASVLTPSRWQVTAQGAARVYADNAAVFVIDDEPGAVGVSAATMTSQLAMRENTDFDLAVSLFLDHWPTTAASERRAGVRIAIGPQTYSLYLRETAAGTAYVANGLVAGVASPPAQVELRVARIGGRLELSARADDAGDFTLLATATVTGEQARLSLFAEDDGTDTATRARFDEVVRRTGDVAGSTRLETGFVVDELFPYRYDTDVQLTSASSLRDDPRLRMQSLLTIDAVDDSEIQYLRAIGDGDDFKAPGIPTAGELVIDDVVLVYDEVVRDGVVFEFKIRGKMDPNLLPLAAGTAVTARTRELATRDAYSFPEPGRLWLRDLPTRDRVWAPVAQEDQRHVQRLYGPLVDLDADASSNAYLRRVQGAWYALMLGPAIENVRIGVHLMAGLPAAQITGVVDRVYERRNLLGEVEERGMVILGKDGAVTHTLSPTVQGIDWAYEPGQSVEKFAPLTTGVEVYDAIADDQWPSRFGLDATSPERYNAFGVLVDINALHEDTSLDDAIRFALRIKPTWSKLFFHLILRSGDETLVVEDDGFFAVVAGLCEDVSFDEGSAPAPPQDVLRMGDGHKMGQGKRLGTSSAFKPFPALGIGLYMGQGLTMGMDPRAYHCAANGDNLATEALETTVVVEVEAGS